MVNRRRIDYEVLELTEIWQYLNPWQRARLLLYGRWLNLRRRFLDFWRL